MKRRDFFVICFMVVLIFSSMFFPLYNFIKTTNKSNQIYNKDLIRSSGQTLYNREWLDNNDFSTQDEWFYTKGALGDNSTVDANISGGNANFKVVGDEQIKEISTPLNDGTWVKFRNDIFLYPDTATINADGCYVSHDYDESINQTRNYHSVHWRKNVSMGKDMSEYIINSASLEVLFNATVNSNVDTANDNFPVQYGIGDFATFYVLISDLNFTNPYRIANNKTSDLGQDSPAILTISDKPIETVDEEDIITAISSSLDKDPDHSNFTITLGIDIYCEDNGPPSNDHDTWDALMIKSFNLTFTYERKVEKFTSISWNQVGDRISGSNFQITQANLKFQVKIDQNWPTTLSPFSEVRILINDNTHFETIRLSSVNSTFQDAKTNGFDVTNLILKDVNITLSIQIFLANTFGLNNNITFSIDDVYLNITYIESFADYETLTQLFLNMENKTMDPYIQLPLASILNLTIKYFDNESNHISGASVKLQGKISGDLTENLDQYWITLNTSDLDIGLWSLTVIAQKGNYSTQLIPFFVEVKERTSEFQIFVDNEEKTYNNTVKIKYDEFMNITILYKDNSTKQHLIGADVSIFGIGDLDEINGQYNITINSNSLSLGFNVLTINAQLENYTTQMFQLYVEVFDRATEMLLYVDSFQKIDGDIIQVEIGNELELIVYYRDEELTTHISGATVRLLGIGDFSEIGSQYNYSLNSTFLNIGFNILAINAQFNNYETQIIQIYVEVFEKASELILYVNDTPTNDSETIQVEVDQFLNVTVYYRDNFTKQHLNGATVELIGWDNFSEISNQYNFTIDTNDARIEQGITILTIQAQINNFQSQTIQFYIKVTERETEMQLFLESDQINKSDTIQVDVNQLLNVTVYYRDNLTKQHLSGATVTIIGIGNFTEIGNQYNYTVDTNLDLEQGISILTVFAYIDNFQPQTFQFYIEVSERASKVTLYLNDIEKTTDPVFEIPIGSILNVTVKYTDNQTSEHISGATTQLIDTTISENFTENSVLNQYTLYLNTSTLKIGVNLLTVVAHANNFQIKSLNLRITINKISTSISTSTGESFINIKPGESTKLAILLINIDFGGPIINANVNYTWAYGQGELTDPDNNGIYEVELHNVLAGTYKITITASAGDDYNFESYELTLNVAAISGLDLTWLIFTLVGAFGALIVGFVSYEKHYKYPPMVRKMRKIRKKIRKGKKIKPISVPNREDLIKIQLKNQRELSNLEFIQLEKKIK